MEDTIFIDIEASGFGRGSYPIEIGIAGPGTDLDCFLVRPFPGWDHWDPKAERLHGISLSTLHAHGRAVAEVAAELNARLGGSTVYTDAWGQDMPWLAKLFDACDVVQAFRVDSVVTLLAESEQARWHALKAKVTEQLRLTRHRASTDAQILKLTYESLVRHASAETLVSGLNGARSARF